MGGVAINQLKNDNFADKQEYYLYKGMADDLMRLLKGPRWSYYFTTEKIVNQFNEIVQKTVRQTGYDNRRYDVGLHLLIACQLKQEGEFIQNYSEFQHMLLDKANEAAPNSLDDIFTAEEIMIMLKVNPFLFDNIENPTKDMQRFILSHRNHKFRKQYIGKASSSVVQSMYERHKLDITDIPYDLRTPFQEVVALVAGKLSLSQVHRTAILKDWNLKYCYISDWDLVKFVDMVESQRASLTPQELERFRLAFVGHVSQGLIAPNGEFIISRMRNPAPSKKVKERAVTKNPYAIGAIPFQYDAIQILALKTGFLPDEHSPGWKLAAVWGNIKKPSVAVRHIYDELVLLQDDMWNIAYIKNQPAWMQLWFLNRYYRTGRYLRGSLSNATSVLKNPSGEVLKKIQEIRESLTR